MQWPHTQHGAEGSVLATIVQKLLVPQEQLHLYVHAVGGLANSMPCFYQVLLLIVMSKC